MHNRIFNRFTLWKKTLLGVLVSPWYTLDRIFDAKLLYKFSKYKAVEDKINCWSRGNFTYKSEAAEQLLLDPWYIYFSAMRHLKFVLVLVIAAADLWECADAKWGDKSELSPRRRRCYDGSLPRRMKKKERKVAGGGGDVCSALYPRASCCPSRKVPYRTDPTVTHSHAHATCMLVFTLLSSSCCSKRTQALTHLPGHESGCVLKHWDQLTARISSWFNLKKIHISIK